MFAIFIDYLKLLGDPNKILAIYHHMFFFQLFVFISAISYKSFWFASRIIIIIILRL